MRRHSIFWGLILLGGGVLILLNALGMGEEYALVPMLGSLLLLAISVASFVKLNFVMGFVPLSIITYLWRFKLAEQFGDRYKDLNIWILLLAAFLLGIGLSVIFWKSKRSRFSHRHHYGRWSSNPSDSSCDNREWADAVTSTDDSECVNVESTFGESIKYVRSTNLKSVHIISRFSSTKVYFDQCQVSPEGTTIQMECSFSGVFLYVPRSWNIRNQTRSVAGNVEGVSFSSGGDIPVTLTGEVRFGNVKIIYV